MAQELERKTTEQTTQTEDHFKWAENELDKNDQLHTKRKSDIIKDLAEMLDIDKQIETQMISTEIAKRLSKYVDHSWVNKILPEKYKDQKHREAVKSRRINPTEETQQESKEASVVENEYAPKQPSKMFYDKLAELQEAVKNKDEKMGTKVVEELRSMGVSEGFPPIFAEHFIKEISQGKIVQYRFRNTNSYETSSNNVKVTMKDLDTWDKKKLKTTVIELFGEVERLKTKVIELEFGGASK